MDSIQTKQLHKKSGEEFLTAFLFMNSTITKFWLFVLLYDTMDLWDQLGKLHKIRGY